MPKTVGFSRDNVFNSMGFLDQIIVWTNQSITTTSSPTFNGLLTTGDVTIGGDLTVNGMTTIISTDVVEIKDNIILLNAEESGAGVTLNLAGIEIERGSLPNFQSIYEESTDLYKIGETGSLQAVATREDSPLDKGIMVYNSSLGRLDSVTSIELPTTFSAGINSTSSITGSVIVTGGGGLGVTGDVYTDSRIFVRGDTYANFIDANASDELIVNPGTNFIFQQNALSQIKVPTDVYLTFSSSNTKIYSNATDLNIGNTNGDINFTTIANGSVTLPVNSYLEWDINNRIRYNSTDIVLDSSGKFIINSPIDNTNTTPSTSSAIGSVKIAGGIGVSNITNAVSSVNGGTFTSAGGAAIRKVLYVGDQINVADQALTFTQTSGQGINFRSHNRIVTTESTNDFTFNSIEGGIINLAAGTITNASSFYITNAPSITGGGNITNSYALWVDGGTSRFDGVINSTNTDASTTSISGAVTLAGGIAISNTTNAVSSTNGGTLTTSGGASIAKTIFIGERVDIGDVATTISQVPGQGINFRSRNRTITTSSAADLAINSFEGGNITTGATLPNAATVYISGAPTVTGGSIINPYALWVEEGMTRLDGVIFINDTTASTSPLTGSIRLQGGVAINNMTDAINEDNGGSLTTAGGIAIKKKLFTGGEITSNIGTDNSYFRLFNTGLHRFTIGLTGSDIGGNAGSDLIFSRYNDAGVLLDNTLTVERSTGNITSLATTASTSSSTGSLKIGGGISISNTTNASGPTNGGTITSAGGGAFSKDFYVGGNSFVSGTFDVDGATTLDQTSINTADGQFSVSGNNGISMIVGNTTTIRTTTGGITIDSDAGTVVVEGNTGVTVDSNAGISIDGNGTSNFTTTSGTMTISGIGLELAGGTGEIDLTTTGMVDINSGTGGIQVDTTDTTNGIKIGSNISLVPVTIGHTSSEVTIGNNLTVGGNLTILGTTTSIESTVTTIVDNAIVVNALPTGLSDGGYLIKRYQPPNDTASGQVILDTPEETGSFQTGSSTPATLILSASASAVNDFYKGWWIRIISGLGINQVRRIKDYTGSTRTATLYETADNTGSFQDGLDLSIAPQAGDNYNLYDCPFAGMYYSEADNEIKFACVPFDTSSGTFPAPSNYITLHVGGLIIEQTFTSNGDFINGGQFVIDYTNPEAFLVRKSGDTGDVFTVDSTGGNVSIANPVNTISSDVTLSFQQLDTLNAVQTYTQINSVLQNNVAGNLRSDLEFKVQRDISGLVTYLTLRGSTSGSAFADFSTLVDAVRVLNSTASTSSVTGALRLSGGLGIGNATDAISATNGGSITTAGGAAIAQKLFVGGQISATDISQLSIADNNIDGTEGSLNVQGDITLYNTTKNTIVYRNTGSAAPSFTTRSVGSKIVLSPNISGSTADYALGIESGAIWYSTSETTNSHRFYLATTEQIRIDNTGLQIRQDTDGIGFFNGVNTSRIYQNSDITRVVPHTASITEGFIFRDNLDTSDRIRVNSNGRISIGLSNYSGAPSITGSLIDVAAMTFTDNVTNASTTTDSMVFNSFKQTILDATNALVTTTDVINTYIGGAPIKGTNEGFTNVYGLYVAQGASVSSSGTITNASSIYIQGAPTGTTITNPYALFIDDGASRFDGKLIITDQSQTVVTDSTINGTEGALNIQGDITLYNSSKNLIIYRENAGSAAPTTTNRSDGTKLVLNPQVAVGNVDYALGIESNAMWYSVQSILASHKFYLGTSSRLQIDDTGFLIDSTSASTAAIIRLNTTDGDDNKGIIIKGGGNGDHTRGAQLQIYGNEFNSGNAILSAGESGQIKFQTGASTDSLIVLAGGQVNIPTTENATGTSTGALRVEGGANIDKSLFVGTDSGSVFALNFNQRYDFLGDVSGNLNIQSKSTGAASKHMYFTNDGDNTDVNVIELYGLGAPGSVTNSEFIRLGFEPTFYCLRTQATGTGTVRELKLETGSNTNQIQLLTTGQVSMSSTEASTSNSTGVLRLSGGIGISDTTNAVSSTNGGTFTTAGGAAVAKDLYVGGNLNVAGTVEVGVSTPSITTSNTTNITGSSVTVSINKLIANGNERTLSVIFRFTPIANETLTSFEFTVPGLSSFTNVYDIVCSVNGFRNDGDPVNVENTIGFAVTSTNRAKVKLTSGGTDVHTIQLIARYTV